MILEAEKKRLGAVVYTQFKEVGETLSSRKGNRGLELDKAIVTVNGVSYDADEQSMDRMNRIVSLANIEFNYRLSVGQTSDVAYQAVYKDQQVSWVGADNVMHTVQIESLAEVLKVAMENMGNIWAKYSI